MAKLTQRASAGGGAAATETDVKTSSPPRVGTKKDDDARAEPAPTPSFLARYADALIVLVLAVLAAATRFHRIENPRSVIFDEAHFNKFTTWYISRHYYVDIHPPLAKLVFAAVLYVLGFVGAQEDKIGASQGCARLGSERAALTAPPPSAPPRRARRRMVGLVRARRLHRHARLAAAVRGRGWLPICVPAAAHDVGDDGHDLRRCHVPREPRNRTGACVSLSLARARVQPMHALTRYIPVSPTAGVAAAFAAWLAMLELVVLVQSRAILCDIFLYTFNIATIGASFASQRPGLTERARLGWCLATGVLLGCAISVKLTAIGTLAVVGVHQAMSLFREAYYEEKESVQGVFVRACCAPRCAARLYASLTQLPSARATDKRLQVHCARRAARGADPRAGVHRLLRALDLAPRHPRLFGPGRQLHEPGVPRDVRASRAVGRRPSAAQANTALLVTSPARSLRTKPPRGVTNLPPPNACPNFDNTWSDCGHAGVRSRVRRAPPHLRAPP